MSEQRRAFRSRELRRVTFAIALLTSAIQLATAPDIHAQSAHSTHVQAVIVEKKPSARPTTSNEGAWEGTLRLTMTSGWHIYAGVPGSSGVATQLVWQLSNGWRTREVVFPKAKQEVRGRDTTYEYEGTLNIPLKLDAPRTKVGNSTHTLTVKYGVCKNVCIDEKVVLQIKTASR
ncbi:MAG: protein-disulfide reductase DsbD domain-containing protein [Gemmatimonadaceae bacterium]